MEAIDTKLKHKMWTLDTMVDSSSKTEYTLAILTLLKCYSSKTKTDLVSPRNKSHLDSPVYHSLRLGKPWMSKFKPCNNPMS